MSLSLAALLLDDYGHASKKLALIWIYMLKTHSARGAACSSVAGSGVTVTDILSVVYWSAKTTFQHFYHWQQLWGCRCHLLVLQTYMLIYRNGAFWNVIYKWLWAHSACMLLVITQGRWSRNINTSSPQFSYHCHYSYMLFNYRQMDFYLPFR